jgi:hypothetical protein
LYAAFAVYAEDGVANNEYWPQKFWVAARAKARRHMKQN